MTYNTKLGLINPKTGKPFYYKDNPEANKKRNDAQMWVDGKYISRHHPLYKEGRYKSFGDAAFSSLVNYENSTQGEVYVITNPAFPDWVKIGMAVDSEDRLKGYQTGDPHRSYKLEFSRNFNDRRKAESKAHVLAGKSFIQSGEWFNMSVQDAINMIEGISDDDVKSTKN
jgi:hypothetical protein|tara:strand:- start:3462 stop:3971 length:510 start_codon:yes stop_codon:yes gene_type:complete